ncbi:MAG: DegV family protein [Dehalococcoidia bacterium]|nr:DegV family protein [Dehalococcoidia bacterium]
MTIKIVTDSSSDIPSGLLDEMGITVVPLFVRFGQDTYRDGIDISRNEFYHKLTHDPNHPCTILPSPGDFLEAYRKLAVEAGGIVSIHLSQKLSGTYQSALQAKKDLAGACPVEVIDSESISMGLGLITIAAARVAAAGGSLEEVAGEARKAVPETHLLTVFDTLKYLARGGRIGKAKELLGSILSTKPLLSLKDGEVVPVGRTRSLPKAIDKIFDFVMGSSNVSDIAVMYSTATEGAEALAGRLAPAFPDVHITIGQIGPVLGTHGGPNIVLVCLRGDVPASF